MYYRIKFKKSSLFLIVKEMIAIILDVIYEFFELDKWVSTHLFFLYITLL